MIVVLCITLCIHGKWGSKEGSLWRWPIAQTNQELQMLPGSNAPGMHEEATKIRITLGSTKTLKLRQNLEKTLWKP